MKQRVVLKEVILKYGRMLDHDMETLEEDLDALIEELGETFIGALEGAVVGYLRGRGIRVG